MSVLLLRWVSYHRAHNVQVLLVYLFFLPVMLPSVLPRLSTDLAVRRFPGVWKLLSLFFLILNFILFLKLYIIVLVLPNIKMNPPQVYMCSPS